MWSSSIERIFDLAIFTILKLHGLKILKIHHRIKTYRPKVPMCYFLFLFSFRYETSKALEILNLIKPYNYVSEKKKRKK
jgi:hypothetical protein